MICDGCRAVLGDDAAHCPVCGREVEPRLPGTHTQAALSDEPLVVVFEAAMEAEAMLVKSLLEQNGVAAVVQRLEVTAFPGAAMFAPSTRGLWGRVQVLADDESRACQLIDDYTQGQGADDVE